VLSRIIDQLLRTLTTNDEKVTNPKGLAGDQRSRATGNAHS
jgi:hypothetical protein